MLNTKVFRKGDVILTTPEEGYFGIAIVLSEKEKTKSSTARCHIAITSIISEEKIKFENIDFSKVKPLEFDRYYDLKNDDEVFSKKEICIGIYTTNNIQKFDIIGNINTDLIYNSELPFEPLYDLEITFPIYGDVNSYLGIEAFLNWERNKNNKPTSH